MEDVAVCGVKRKRQQQHHQDILTKRPRSMRLEEEHWYNHVCRLIANGGDVNHRDNYGRTALFNVCEAASLTMVDLLLARDGVDVNIADRRGWTPLITACFYASIDIIGLLLQRRDINVNAADQSGRTALLMTCRGLGILSTRLDHKERLFAILVALVNSPHHVDFSAVDTDKTTALMSVCQGGYMPAVELVLQHTNLDIVNATGPRGETALFRAAAYPFSIEPLKRLLQVDGIDVNSTDTFGRTIFHLMHRSYSTVRGDCYHWHARLEVCMQHPYIFIPPMRNSPLADAISYGATVYPQVFNDYWIRIHDKREQLRQLYKQIDTEIGICVEVWSIIVDFCWALGESEIDTSSAGRTQFLRHVLEHGIPVVRVNSSL